MRDVDLVSIRQRFFIVSLALIVFSLVLLAIPPTLRPGIEFTAGTTTLLRFEGDVSQSNLRNIYAELGHDEARIQSTGDQGEFLIRTSELHVPDSALIEVVPVAPDSSVIDFGYVYLGAEGTEGEVSLRAFHFGDTCDFGIEIAAVPVGTEARVFEQVYGCTVITPKDDVSALLKAPADSSDRKSDGIVAYRVQAVVDSTQDIVTGFIAPSDTYGLLPSENDDSSVGSSSEGVDLGERGVIESELEARLGAFEVLEFASVSAVVSKRAVRNATVAVAVAALFIMGYVVFAFSSMPHPFRYAVAAIIALLHDVIIVLGVFSLFGKLFGIEINLMFVTGLLTVIGFSVHDTIVVFDRVRENVRLAPAAPFTENVNASLVQTLGRSLNTSITLLITILALLWLGGSTIQSFLLVLVVGVIAGAYSSIAIAAQVLVAWENRDLQRLFSRVRGGGLS